jgi:hypothetical protein
MLLGLGQSATPTFLSFLATPSIFPAFPRPDRLASWAQHFRKKLLVCLPVSISIFSSMFADISVAKAAFAACSKLWALLTVLPSADPTVIHAAACDLHEALEALLEPEAMLHTNTHGTCFSQRCCLFVYSLIVCHFAPALLHLSQQASVLGDLNSWSNDCFEAAHRRQQVSSLFFSGCV